VTNGKRLSRFQHAVAQFAHAHGRNLIQFLNIKVIQDLRWWESIFLEQIQEIIRVLVFNENMGGVRQYKRLDQSFIFEGISVIIFRHFNNYKPKVSRKI
jgi:hypothetical protein